MKMGLNDIQLNATLIQNLYTKVLVDTEISEPNNNSAKTVQRHYLGNNQSHICIIVNEKKSPLINDEDLGFLTNILSACNLSLADIVLLNSCSNPKPLYAGICKEFSPKIIILFGVAPTDAGIPMEFPPFKLQNYNEQFFLISPLLSTLKNNKEEKGKLWVCLQSLFKQ